MSRTFPKSLKRRLTFKNDGVLAFPPQRLQNHMQGLGGREPARVHRAFVVNHQLFGKDPFEGVLALPAGDEVQHGDLALLQPAAADLVRAVDVHGAPDVALVKLHEGPTVDDDGHRPDRVAQRAMRQLLGQLVGVDDPHAAPGQAGGEAGRAAVARRRAPVDAIADSGVQVGAAGADRAVFLVGGHRATAGTAASTRQRARGAAGRGHIRKLGRLDLHHGGAADDRRLADGAHGGFQVAGVQAESEFLRSYRPWQRHHNSVV